MADLTDRVVVVTGAAGGIGSALARRLHVAGARLVLTSRDAGRLAALTDELAGDGDGDRVTAVPADLADAAQVARLYEEVGRRTGHVDALVNLAGRSIPGEVADTDVEDYLAVWHSNVTSAFLSSKHVLPLMKPQSGAQVVNVSSLAGRRPNATAPLYCTAKAALDMFTRAFGLQVRERGIRVTTLAPGGVDTPFWGDRPVDRSALMTADDVVDAVEFVLRTPARVQISSIELEAFGR
ncbi:SDR family oxidoreductase [Jiangella anatolica]|uniref:Ketoreductase domain-containing protein n=1 Tax=Jiangella anatolica TaxID=2670374 RepID=A0A2W2CBN0_9ACTN|nr:SDR family oxidoreductase [Jiangella anatolica]PZF85599.1 hypothetical protein C1I92_04330 [Jiangella anatolica]